MQAPDDNDQSSGREAGGAGSPSAPGDPMGPGEGGSTGEESGAAGGDPQVDGAPLDLGPAGEASASDRDLGSQMQEFSLTVPFRSNAEAEVARRFLLSGVELYEGMVHWDLTLSGSDLLIQLTAEDPDLLQISTASLLIQLFILVQIMQHLVPLVFDNFQSKRAN